MLLKVVLEDGTIENIAINGMCVFHTGKRFNFIRAEDSVGLIDYWFTKRGYYNEWNRPQPKKGGKKWIVTRNVLRYFVRKFT